MHVINLSKNQVINLTKEVPAMSKCFIGMGWKQKANSKDVDLDVSALPLDKDNNPIPEWFIFYNNLQLPNNSIVHQGDNLEGGDGAVDDEVIKLDLTKIPTEIHKIIFVITNHTDPGKVMPNFVDVDTAFARVVNEDTGEEIARMSAEHLDPDNDGLEFCALVRKGREFELEHIQHEFTGGLEAFLNKYTVASKHR